MPKKLIERLIRSRRLAVVFLMVVFSASLLAGCGEEQAAETPEAAAAHATGNFLVIIRVEDRLDGGEWVPLADVSIEYEILGAGSDSRKALQKFSDVTDANGYSVVFRDAGDLESSQIGVVATDLKAPDNRARQARKLSSSKFDFEEFFAEFLGDQLDVKAVIGEACASAANPSHCETVLNESGLETWGAGILVRLTPIRER